MLFLAMSCLQGRPAASAARELLALEPEGLQLTPGNVPTRNFVSKLHRAGVPLRSHEGWCDVAYRRPVWGGPELLVDHDSVHPPATLDELLTWAQTRPDQVRRTAIEVMYGDHCLGTGREVEAAMEAELRLALDVSHVFIQRSTGAMSEATWQRLQRYDRLVELHVSSNDGRNDLHRPVTLDDFGVAWALDRAGDLPVVVESYLHKLTEGDRRSMLDPLLVRAGAR